MKGFLSVVLLFGGLLLAGSDPEPMHLFLACKSAGLASMLLFVAFFKNA